MSIFDMFRKNGSDEGEESKPTSSTSPTKVTVGEILDDYVRDFTLRGCRSKKSLSSEVATLKLYFGEHLPVEELTKAVIRDFQRIQRETGLAAATVNKQLADLRAALNVACENEKIASVPAWPKRLRAAKPRQGFLERQDYLAVREALPGPWARDILDFGYYSGWRKNEILKLTWKEVDLTAQQIRLDPDRAKNYQNRPPLQLADFGLEAIRRREAERLPNVDYVFTREDGHRPISSTTWHYVWAAATEKAGLAHLLFHDLRRTVVRNLEIGGVPRSIAMGWVGHRTEAIYQRYCITTERDLVPAAERFIDTITGRKREETAGPLEDESVRLRVVERFKPPTLDDDKLYD